jgi:hypothetical protein
MGTTRYYTMTDLSPTAQAVVNAAVEVTGYGKETWLLKARVAAALEAAADQVVPEEEDLNPVDAWSVEDWNHMNITRYQREETRRQLLAIAAELRPTTTQENRNA